MEDLKLLVKATIATIIPVVVPIDLSDLRDEFDAYVSRLNRVWF